MKSENQVVLEFPSRSSNEAFARVAAAGFAMQLDPTLEELGDIKTAVSEAVTNAIVHGYPENFGRIVMKLRLLERQRGFRYETGKRAFDGLMDSIRQQVASLS